MTTAARWVLTWSIYPGPGPGRNPLRGAYCPAGGLSTDEADRCKARLYERARAAGILPVGEKRAAGASYIGAAAIRYAFSIEDAPLTAEEVAIANDPENAPPAPDQLDLR